MGAVTTGASVGGTASATCTGAKTRAAEAGSGSFGFNSSFQREEKAAGEPVTSRDLGQRHARLRGLLDDALLLRLTEAAAPSHSPWPGPASVDPPR
jgi:hypothetical protein